MKEFKLSSPWVTYANEIAALFEKDPEVKVLYTNDGPEVKLFVESEEKAEALMAILPKVKTYGNVEMKVTVIPANGETMNTEAIFRKAFKGNEAFSDAVTLTGVFTNPITFVVFTPEVVQFWNDDMSDAFGNWNGLMQDIAKDVIEPISGVYYSTLPKDKEGVTTPGEWLTDTEE